MSVVEIGFMTLLTAAHYGFGKHMIMLSFDQITAVAKVRFLIEILQMIRPNDVS